MKVLVKFGGRTETVENVSVDDKCLPVVAGLHPYPSSARDTSPLVRESALWFKTLAVQAVYIDCDRRLIYWTPIVNDAGTVDVLMRRSATVAASITDFIPDTAKPLFKDSTVYDFDASLKEMMGKCSEAAKKYFKKSQSTDDFHEVIAKVLHMYILPSITFTLDDIFCLTRAQSLIETRLGKSEDEITNKANSIDILRKCLHTLKSSMLLREDLDSERYLRTCKKDFLVAFLQTVESDVDTLNIELSAEQSKVNWAKAHPDGSFNLHELQEKRNSLFHEVGKSIKVREAIKNVISRRDLTKRKVKKCEVINSCFHNVFVEIVRRLEVEERILSQLGSVKVNICAAREAVVCTILEMVNNNRNSDRATKFEPEDFADFSVNENQNVEKSDVWLTFQERVARILENNFSSSFTLHKDGCRGLISKINLALSEFHLTKKEAYRLPQHFESVKISDKSSPFSVALNDVTVRESKSNADYSRRREAVLMSGENESCSALDLHPVSDTKKAQTLGTTKTSCLNSFERRAVSTNIVSPGLLENQTEVSNVRKVNEQTMQRSASETSLDDILNGTHLSPIDEQTDNVDSVTFRKSEYPLKRQRHFMTEQLALSSLMNSIDDLKVQVQCHFREAITCLGQELHRDLDETSGHELQELLWKSYERFFCQEVYVPLMELYVTSLTPAIRKAFISLRKTSMHEILKDDKLLDLFFGGNEMSSRTVSIPVPSCNQSKDKFSMARTLSSLSLDVRNYDINDLYSLANADGDELSKRFNLDVVECDEEDVKTSSSESFKSADLSLDDEAFDIDSESPTTSAHSAVSSTSLDQEILHNSTEKLKILSDPEKVEVILEPILSPFRKLVRKCLDATCFLDKVRYITNAIEGLNKEISQMIGPDFQSACDDIISMLILALYNLSEDMFIGLYINLRLLMDVLPSFLSGTLWDYNLVTLCVTYDYLFTRKACELVIKQYPGSFKVKK